MPLTRHASGVCLSPIMQVKMWFAFRCARWTKTGDRLWHGSVGCRQLIVVTPSLAAAPSASILPAPSTTSAILSHGQSAHSYTFRSVVSVIQPCSPFTTAVEILAEAVRLICAPCAVVSVTIHVPAVAIYVNQSTTRRQCQHAKKLGRWCSTVMWMDDGCSTVA